jgi:hypothetical protein
MRAVDCRGLSLLSCLVLLTSACGVSTLEVDAADNASMEGEGVGDDLGSLEQGITSSTPYYHWSNRTDHHAAAYEGCSPNLLQVLAYMKNRWGGQSLGCHNNRYVKGQGGSTTWSTHSWGAALDYTSGSWDTNFNQVAAFLIQHSEELGINALHDYRRVSHPDGTFRGRIWKPLVGWKPSNIGDPGTWIHVEVRPGKYTDGRTVNARLSGGGETVGADGCTATRRAEAAAYGCSCVDGQPNGGWCPGTGCSAAQTAACGNYGAGCADGQCKGIFAPGYACTPLEFKNCSNYLSGCTNHQCLAGRVGGDDGRNCDEQSIYNCGRYGCGCKNNQCSDGSCPIIP